MFGICILLGPQRQAKLPQTFFQPVIHSLKRVQLMTATGGSVQRDLFVDPNDRNTLTDYMFDSLITACRNIIKQGLKPVIITGNVPLKFCETPSISGAFGVNVRPPDDFDQYYTYIKAIADAIVKEFRINEVKTWSWGVLTEYENKDWFENADGTANSTKIDYFKLYDYTVAALQASIGADNLSVGAHSMTCSKGLWDETEFIDHCAFDVNYKTGEVGTQINYLTASYYDFNPGKFNTITLDDCINKIRDKAIQNGFTNLKFGVDEGRILAGPDGKDLGSRIVAHSYQGVADAKQYKDMIENNINWFTTWGLNSEDVWGAANSVSTNISILGYKMVGDNYISSATTGTPLNTNDQVEGIGGYNNSTNTAHFMVYNFNSDMNETNTEPITIILNNVAPVNGSNVTIKQWFVDDTHGNWWPTWWKDQTNRGLTDSSYSWSKYSVTIPSVLINQSDRDYWYSRVNTYHDLAALSFTSNDVTINNNKITLTSTLTHHGVVFYEITNVKYLR
jgi:hypothetical protein